MTVRDGRRAPRTHPRIITLPTDIAGWLPGTNVGIIRQPLPRTSVSTARVDLRARHERIQRAPPTTVLAINGFDGVRLPNCCRHAVKHTMLVLYAF